MKKKINNKGFTLIELLAVITIMGILLMVAIPAVSRTIENSRRDTFASTAHEYVSAVRNAVLADNIECKSGADYVSASATPDGTYYFSIDTTKDAASEDVDSGTKDLMESGGKSPFGNADMQGYVKWVKTTDNSNPQNPKTTTKYKLYITDTGKHGMTAEDEEANVKRATISTKVTANAPKKPTDPDDATYCRIA